jgi:phosphoglycolate phosphatase
MMSNALSLVVFDWEGTLIDTLGQIVDTVFLQAKRLGFGEVDKALVRQYVHLGLVNAVHKWFPTLTLTEQEKLLQNVQQAMLCKPSEICLMQGVRPLLEELKERGVLLAIATNKGHASLQRALQAAELTSFFTITRSAGQTPPKPCPQMLQEIMEFCNTDAAHTIMIGDSSTDIEMAQAIGVKALGVDFYHQQHEVLLSAGAAAVFDDYALLSDYLKQSFLNGV